MKIKILFTLLFFILILAIVLNPSKLKHQNIITKSLVTEIGSKIKITENDLKDDTVFKKMIHRKNYFIFSTSSLKYNEKEFTISYGIFNFVFIKIGSNRDILEKILDQIRIYKLWIGNYNNFDLNQRKDILESLCYCCPGPIELNIITNNNDLFVTEKILPSSNSTSKKVNINSFKVIDQKENYIIYEGIYPPVVFRGKIIETKMKSILYKIDKKLFIKDLYNSECENDSFAVVKLIN